MTFTPELMPSDEEIGNNFLRSDFWLEVRATEGFKRKRVMKKAMREYLKSQYAWLAKPEEATELEKYVGRVEFLIRSRWGKKAARTKARNKKRRKRLITKLAERAYKKYVAQRKAERAAHEAFVNPLLFGENLPIQMKPSRKVA